MAGCYGESPRLVPESAMKKYRKRPPKTLPRIPEGTDGHEQDWVRACKGGKPASSSFEYSGPLSEAVLMGNLAGPLPRPGAAVGRRQDGSDQRRGRQRLRPSGVPRGLAPVVVPREWRTRSRRRAGAVEELWSLGRFLGRNERRLVVPCGHAREQCHDARVGSGRPSDG